MSDVRINTIADMRRALERDDVVVYMDRNDLIAERLRREPARMAEMSKPRTVSAVRSKEIVFETANGKSHLGIPNKTDFGACGDNTFTIAVPNEDGTRPTIEYRVEVAGTPGASRPSRLHENHPPIGDEQREAESRARAAEAARRAAASAEHSEAFERMRAMPLPQQTPRHKALVTRTKKAIEDALARKVFYEDDLTRDVGEATADSDYAVAKQMPTQTVIRAETDVAPYVLLGIAARRLAFEPRGTWMIFEEDMGHGISRTALISTGGPEPAYAHHPYQGGGYAETKRRLDGKVEYDLRKVIEREAEAVANRAATDRRGFATGQTFSYLEIGGHLYRRATIRQIDASGNIELEAQRPRSPKGHRMTCTPARLDAALGKAKQT